MRDEARYRAYVDSRAPALRRTAYLACGDWHRAEDAVQTVLIALYATPPRDWGAVDAWVRKALMRRLIDESRRPWRRERPFHTLPDRVAPGTPDLGERSAVLDALRTLPARQRAAVVLRFWDDLSVAQTAHALRLSEGTVKSHTSRGLAALRNVLEESSP